VIPESTHGSSFATDTATGSVIQLLRLDEGKSNVTVKDCVMDKIDLLLATLTKEFLDLVPVIGK